MLSPPFLHALLVTLYHFFLSLLSFYLLPPSVRHFLFSIMIWALRSCPRYISKKMPFMWQIPSIHDIIFRLFRRFIFALTFHFPSLCFPAVFVHTCVPLVNHSCVFKPMFFLHFFVDSSVSPVHVPCVPDVFLMVFCFVYYVIISL